MNNEFGDIELGGEPLNEWYSIEQAISRLIKDSLATPLYRRRPQNAALPCVCYEIKESTYEKYLNGSESIAKITFEYSIFSQAYDDLASIGKALRNILDTFSGLAKNRKILQILHNSEHDEIETPDDAGQKSNYIRVQEYEVTYLENDE